MLKPHRLISMTQHFMKHTTQNLKEEVSMKFCDGENIQSGKLEGIMKDYSLWEEYQDQMQKQKSS